MMLLGDTIVRYEFDPDKAVETIIYVAKRIGHDLYRTLKIIYLADKAHLEKYGCFIFGDKYAALVHGPVPSKTYDAIKSVRSGKHLCLDVECESETFKVVDDINIYPERDPNLDYFSESDLECLDFAIEEYGSLSFGALKKLTHDDAYNASTPNSIISIEAIASTLPNAADLIQHLKDPYPG